MARDFAFTFYPGDYLRDTQCLSEKPQVAYDRIMCEHMRNIIISPERLDFFTKRLNPDEKQELASVLFCVPGGFQIKWVADSIGKSMAYSESRSKNRTGKKKDMNNTSSTQDNHRKSEEEIEDENENKDEGMGEGGESSPSYGDERLLVPQMLHLWKVVSPSYPDDPQLDAKALYSIAAFLCKRGNLRGAPTENAEPILEAWEQLCGFIADDRFYKQKSLKTISNCIQEILQKALNGDQSKPAETGKRTGKQLDPEKLKAGLRDRFARRQQGAG